MNLHANSSLFNDAIQAASEYLNIKPTYIEKDYWISKVLKQMSEADPERRAIFKGGTSLSKAHSIGFRFSEDIDIAIADSSNLNGNQLKMLIKRIAKSMTAGLEEIVMEGVTSKGSRYYKAIYAYKTLQQTTVLSPNIEPVTIGQIMVEINSFANPYPYVRRNIESFITVFLKARGRKDIVAEYGMEGFELNVLDTKRTLTEKIVSLIRFSLSDNYRYDLPAKIRHFYDIYYLLQESDCNEYLHSENFKRDFYSLLEHDRCEFEKPYGWKSKSTSESPLLSDFQNIWENVLSTTYKKELPNIAYGEVPSADEVAGEFEKIIGVLS